MTARAEPLRDRVLDSLLGVRTMRTHPPSTQPPFGVAPLGRRVLAGLFGVDLAHRPLSHEPVEEDAPATTGPPPRRGQLSHWSRCLAQAVLSLFVMTSCFGGVSGASSDALPGDSLYGIKRGIEDFELNYLADGADQRGQAYLDQAATRLSEAQQLMERDHDASLDHQSVSRLRRALSGLHLEAAAGHRLLDEAYEHDPDSLAPIQALSVFSRTHRAAWEALRDRLPVQLKDVSDQVSSVFDAIDEEVAPLRSLLTEPPSPYIR